MRNKRYLADVKASEDKFNARRQKKMEEAAARCNHADLKDGDCLICFPVEPKPEQEPVSSGRLTGVTERE